MRTLSNALTSDVVNVVLALLHTIDVLLEADQLITRLGGLVAEELCDLHTGLALAHERLALAPHLISRVDADAEASLVHPLSWHDLCIESRGAVEASTTVA